MIYVNSVMGFLMDWLLWPFAQAWPALVAAALATSVIMLLIMRWTGSPAAVRRAKDRLVARVLELVLFRHDAFVSFTAGGRVFAANLAYLRTLLRPLAFSILPCLLILSQLSCWFAWRPLRMGEAAVVTVTLLDGFPLLERPVGLSPGEVVRIETEGVRVPALSEIDWRIRAVRNGTDSVEVAIADEPAVRKQIIVGTAVAKVSQCRTRGGLWDQFLHPAEPPIDKASSIARVHLHYPVRQLWLGNREVDWLVAFVILTMVFGIVLKRPLGVEI
jgi:hypothetical protein